MKGITFEACITKSMYALANISREKMNSFLIEDFCGEMIG